MSIPPNVLLIGFEPFAGERVNPSAEIVRALEGEVIAAHRVVGSILPVAFAATLPMLEELLQAHRPALALALGQAGGRGEISLERVAINLIDARIADNAGAQPVDEQVVAGAPAAYFSTLPVKAIAARLRELGIPAAPSFSAGSFVCNQVFFGLAHLIVQQNIGARGGFVHVPWLPEQAAQHVGQPSMSLATMVDGIRAAIECAITTPNDIAVAGGTIA